MEGVDPEKQKMMEQESEGEIKHFRMTLTHRECKGLEAVVTEIARRVQALRDKQIRVRASGPARMPIKRLTITTRKSPCGNGTATFDRFDMKLHKRVFNFHCSQHSFQQILSFLVTPPGTLIDAHEIEESRGRTV